MEEHEICHSIRKRRRVRFWYRGGVRTVEPYAYGVGDGGRPLLRAYQVSGHSRLCNDNCDVRSATTRMAGFLRR